MNKIISESFRRLETYVSREDYKGWDPYDGLNSKIFASIPFLNSNKIAKLVWIQFFKRSLLNLRKPLMVEKQYNPKGVALFLEGYCNLYNLSGDLKHLEMIHHFAAMLIKLNSDGWSGNCWGYNFDWQARAFFQPKYGPTVVATCYAANALINAYEITGNREYLEFALSSKDFVTKDLNRTYDADGDFAFSYSPMDNTQVFNASLLGSRLLSRIYTYTGEEELKKLAKSSVLFCIKHQKPDGSWSYGTLSFHQWIDNFHTGYNLECLKAYSKYCSDDSIYSVIEKGFEYYVHTFFSKQGQPKYYHNKMYPIDTQNTAQLVLTLSKLDKFDEYQKLADRVLIWTIQNMQDNQGFFFYQNHKYYTIKIPYMRWTQAWMFYAMSEYLKKYN